MELIAPGIWKLRHGTPERTTPAAFRSEQVALVALALMPPTEEPFDLSAVRFQVRQRGCTVDIPMEDSESLYGLGLQINSFQERGIRKQLVVDCVPVGKRGHTHAPSTFYVSSKGYGVYVDTARYPTVYCGTHRKVGQGAARRAQEKKAIALSVEELYHRGEAESADMVFDIPAARGVDVYVFAGPTMLDAVRRYNLFAGGGCLPPMWGLGVKYRVRGDFSSLETLKMACYFRENHIPCDMLGLEPGWQTHAYSCTYVWSPERFPDHESMLARLGEMNFSVNLWEHAYVHPDSPLYGPLEALSGDYPVWHGLVPDFADERARDIFAAYHETHFVEKGIGSFKLDECDNASFFDPENHWGFPECSTFPSDVDGEQMHQLFGLLNQKLFYELYRKHNRRTWLDVRASNAMSAPYPAVLYSDIYDHDQYVRMILTSGFGGLLWSPEVRQCDSVEDLVRRAQTAIFAPLTCFNSWMIKNPPWLQFDIDKNNSDDLLANAAELEALFRNLLELRMSLVPYLYAAFVRYHIDGTPPFRALVLDYEEDPRVRELDNEYMVGDSVLVAPFLAGASARRVYLPDGRWYDFWDGNEFVGGQEHNFDMGLDRFPVFVREGSILPLARPVEFVTTETLFQLECRVYGETCRPCTLYEDDGVSYDFDKGHFNKLVLAWDGNSGRAERKGNYPGKRYEVTEWVRV